MMSKGKLQLCARPTGSRGWEAAQTEWMYLLFMWKSMGPDRWWFVSSLFTPRLHDKCPHCPSWADGAQVSKKNNPFPSHSKLMTDVPAMALFLCPFKPQSIPLLLTYLLYGLETALNSSKEKFICLISFTLDKYHYLQFYLKHPSHETLKKPTGNVLISENTVLLFTDGLMTHIVEQETDSLYCTLPPKIESDKDVDE